MKDWQRIALSFNYQDQTIVDRLYNEYVAAELRGDVVSNLRGRPKHQDGYDSSPERTKKIINAYRSGETLEEISRSLGITRERVRQILKKRAGMTRLDGGSAAKRLKSAPDIIAKIRAKEARIAEKHFKAYGCTKEYLDSVSELRRTNTNHPVVAFRQMKRSAINRGIGWNLTFKEWWEIWKDSGKWEKRGRGKNCYCMSRLADTGPYEIGNVEIVTNSQNGADYQAFKNTKKQGAIRGVYCLYPGTKKPWAARYGNKSIGYFETQDKAAEARDNYLKTLQ